MRGSIEKNLSTESLNSVDDPYFSLAEDTPSNYNDLNQRFDVDVKPQKKTSNFGKKPPGTAGGQKHPNFKLDLDRTKNKVSSS
mmetsp:Transcript_39449/g.35205  ORF Transcript_39449/g.35205 Transcript_39449/m.35205 type:complete len:83 (+) Transcript_39449:907-1155(+)